MGQAFMIKRKLNNSSNLYYFDNTIVFGPGNIIAIQLDPSLNYKILCSYMVETHIVSEDGSSAFESEHFSIQNYTINSGNMVKDSTTTDTASYDSHTGFLTFRGKLSMPDLPSEVQQYVQYVTKFYVFVTTIENYQEVN